MPSSEGALKNDKEHLCLVSTKLLLMPKACTMDLKKCGDADAAQTCSESPIFRHVCACAAFAF